MTFGITYEELSDIANHFLKENESEELDIITEPLTKGLLIHVKKFDTGSLTLKGRIEFIIDSFENGLLTIRLRFRNIFYELMKKVLMGIVIKIFLKKMKEENEEEDSVDPMQFVHFKSNTVSIETTAMFETMKIPVDLLVIKQKEGSLIIGFNFRPDRLSEKEDQK